MNELDKLLIHFRPPNKFNFFSNYKKKHNNKEQGKQILSCRLFGVLCCSLESEGFDWSKKSSTLGHSQNKGLRMK
jgi:hypothetical protein